MSENLEKLKDFEADGGVWINDIDRYGESLAEAIEDSSVDAESIHGNWVVTGFLFGEADEDVLIYDPEEDALESYSFNSVEFDLSHTRELRYRPSDKPIPRPMWTDARELLEQSGFSKTGEFSAGYPSLQLMDRMEDTGESVAESEVGGDKYMGEIFRPETDYYSRGSIEARLHPEGVDVRIRSDYTGDIPRIERIDGLYLDSLYGDEILD